MQRTFVFVANRAVPTGNAPLDDLAGAGGRFDVVTRFVLSALLTSHGMRRDTEALVLFTNTPGEPKALRVPGDRVRGIGPDERSTAAVLNKGLVPVAMPVWQDAGQGMAVCELSLAKLLDELDGPVVLLDGDGDELAALGLDGGAFVVGDQDGLTEEQLALVRKRADHVASVGPVPLQADQVAVVVNNVLDRA